MLCGIEYLRAPPADGFVPYWGLVLVGHRHPPERVWVVRRRLSRSRHGQIIVHRNLARPKSTIGGKSIPPGGRDSEADDLDYLAAVLHALGYHCRREPFVVALNPFANMIAAVTPCREAASSSGAHRCLALRRRFWGGDVFSDRGI
jgi:hypothetical protein